MTIKKTVLDYVRELGEEFSPKDVSDALGLNANTVRRVVQELHSEGMLARSSFRGKYIYENDETAFVYRFEGFKDGKKVTTVYTSDHKLNSGELERVERRATEGQGNAELVAEGESEDFDEALLNSYDVVEEDYFND